MELGALTITCRVSINQYVEVAHLLSSHLPSLQKIAKMRNTIHVG